MNYELEKGYKPVHFEKLGGVGYIIANKLTTKCIYAAVSLKYLRERQLC